MVLYIFISIMHKSSDEMHNTFHSNESISRRHGIKYAVNIQDVKFSHTDTIHRKLVQAQYKLILEKNNQLITKIKGW